MEENQLILELYRITTEAKENFIERSFKTNKFYLCLAIVLFTLLFLSNSFTNCNIQIYNLVISITGLFISILWYLNQDTYGVLIKLKYSKVLEIIENSFPQKPNQMEFSALQELKTNKKEFVFSDIQKFLAGAFFFVYMIYLLKAIIPMLLTFFNISLI